VAAGAVLLPVAHAAAQRDPLPVQSTSSEAPAPRADLVVRIVGPEHAAPGETIAKQLLLTVTNSGAAPAWGTVNHASGYMVDLTLGRDTAVAVGFKAYSPHFAEDVLLEGGRVSRTVDLAPAVTRRYAVEVVIPWDVPPGRLHLCAFVDPGNAVAEANERNNTACVPLRVAGAPIERPGGSGTPSPADPPAPGPDAIEASQPGGGHE